MTPRWRRFTLLRRPGLMALAATLLALVVALIAACGARTPASEPTPVPLVLVAALGGKTTAYTTTRNAFGLSARNLNNQQRRTFAVGNSFFRQNWVTAPASTEARDGLGPTFNALSCSSCHLRDGRGKPPSSPDDGERGLLLRLSIPGVNANGNSVPEPAYGGQLQDRAIIGVPAEGQFTIVYQEIPGTFDDGETYSLRSPTYEFRDLAFGPMHAETMTSPRVAPAIVGMGLLEAIPEADYSESS